MIVCRHRGGGGFAEALADDGGRSSLRLSSRPQPVIAAPSFILHREIDDQETMRASSRESDRPRQRRGFRRFFYSAGQCDIKTGSDC
jgi:hypothetical protein